MSRKRECWEIHQRKGIVTTHPDGYPEDSKEGHFSAQCCGAPECVRELAGEAYKVAGILGVYCPDPQRKVPVAASLEARS